jgi:hypothetical protein
MIFQILIAAIITYFFYRKYKVLKVSLVFLFLSQLLMNLSYGLLGNLFSLVLIIIFLVWINFYQNKKWNYKAFLITVIFSSLYLVSNLLQVGMKLYLQRDEQEIMLKAGILFMSIFFVSSLFEYKFKKVE